MSNYDIVISKRNIERLRKEKSLSQNELAKIAGVTQNRVSRVLSEDNSDFFTIPQLVNIAKHDTFNVSLDYLLGINTHPKTKRLSVHDVCRMLVEIDNTIPFSINEKCVEEEIVYINPFDNEIEPTYNRESQSIDYYMLWFQECQTSDEISKDDYYLVDINKSSRKPDHIEINNFLKKYFKLRDLKKSDIIDEETFQDIINSHLSKLSTEPICDYENLRYFACDIDESNEESISTEDVPFN